MFLPDGHTPFPPEAMPLMRALAGETSDQVGMVIRNASRPDGVVITVSAQPLHKADGHVSGHQRSGEQSRSQAADRRAATAEACGRAQHREVEPVRSDLRRPPDAIRECPRTDEPGSQHHPGSDRRQARQRVQHPSSHALSPRECHHGPTTTGTTNLRDTDVSPRSRSHTDASQLHTEVQNRDSRVDQHADRWPKSQQYLLSP